MGAWRIRIRGKQRQEIDLNLLVQAVIALGYQLAEEARQQAEQDSQLPAATTPPVPEVES